MAVKPIPEGYHTLTPHIVVSDAAKAIEFYEKAFGAKEVMRMDGPGGSVLHAEIKIGDSPIMIAEEHPDMGVRSPLSIGGSPVTLNLHVADCDKMFNQAVSAGATATMPPADQFWGDRYGKLKDPFGHHWAISTHTEDLTPEEIGNRAKAFFSQGAGT
jgi:PhnB protein